MPIYQRAFSIHIDNPLDQTPTCTFQQERVGEIDGQIFKEPIGELRVTYDVNDPRAVLVYDTLRAYYIDLITPAEPEVIVEPTPEPEEPLNG